MLPYIINTASSLETLLEYLQTSSYKMDAKTADSSFYNVIARAWCMRSFEEEEDVRTNGIPRLAAGPSDVISVLSSFSSSTT
jgi:hypothetical protein